MNARLPLAWMSVGVSILAWAAWAKPAVRIVYNASDSAPRGFYIVSPATDLQIGDYVVARLPEATAKLAGARGYLSRSVPVLKQIAALPGQQVCIRNGAVYTDGIAVARTLSKDGKGRPLAPWNACRPLVEGEIFLLNSGNPASFDSRYFGPLDVSFLRGRAVHL
jgi:conjugative transfer signal peptidase TraF